MERPRAAPPVSELMPGLLAACSAVQRMQAGNRCTVLAHLSVRHPLVVPRPPLLVNDSVAQVGDLQGCGGKAVAYFLQVHVPTATELAAASAQGPKGMKVPEHCTRRSARAGCTATPDCQAPPDGSKQRFPLPAPKTLAQHCREASHVWHAVDGVLQVVIERAHVVIWRWECVHQLVRAQGIPVARAVSRRLADRGVEARKWSRRAQAAQDRTPHLRTSQGPDSVSFSGSTTE